MQILVATTNRHKLREIKSILSDPFLTLVSLAELESPPEVIEDGDTFEKNAIKKAVELAKFSGMWTLADDSGLEVSALNGEPGVLSARYAGEPVDYKANNRKLLKELEGRADRSARFVCVIALSDPEGKCGTVEGVVSGVIAATEKGDEGFGYDPLFIPDGYDRTFAEMSADEKNALSHRGRALESAVSAWSGLLHIGAVNESPADDFCKICELRDEFLAQRVSAELADKGIPYFVRSYRDSAYDGIFQSTLGWGHLEASPRHRAEVLEIVSALQGAE